MSEETTPCGPLQRLVSLHTPGPWVATKDPDGCAEDWMIGPPDGKPDLVAVCSAKDAALIAAAPDLLDALQAACMAMTGYLHRNAVIDAAQAKAAAAVSKALGVQANAMSASD